MTGIIDVGGGMRGVFSAGIYDVFIENGITFDLCIGVSAGSANLASFVAQNHGRVRRFYVDYPRRRQYMSMDNLLRRGSFIDLDYIYSTLSNTGGEDPIDFRTFAENPSDFIAVATDGKTGRPKYFGKDMVKLDDLTVLKASCCLPAICKPINIGGTDYFDGGVSDPIPCQKAFEMGCDKVVIIISKPIDFRKSAQKHMSIIKRALRSYPEIYKDMTVMHKLYNAQLDQAAELEKQGKVIILAPDDCFGVDTLTREPEHLEKLYAEGRRCAYRHLNEIRAINEKTA